MRGNKGKEREGKKGRETKVVVVVLQSEEKKG